MAVVNVGAPSVSSPDPSPQGRRRAPRRPFAQRVFNLIAGLLAVVVLIVSVGGFVVVRWFDGSISRVHLSLGQSRPADAPVGTQNWLLVGTDNGRADVPGTRSDTTILAHLDQDGTTTNVSFPRDTLVTIPAYVDSKGKAKPAHKDKFNSAILLGGPSLLVRTVELMTGVRVDHYVSVNLAGFKKISQVLNGVQVCILKAPDSANEDNGALTNINDGFSGFHGKYGVQTIVGDQALAFVRQRHGLPDSDLSRIQRQQQFLGSVFRTATRVNLLFNPVAITRLLAAIQKALTLDEGTSLSDLENLAFRLKGVDPSKVVFETIPQRSLETTDTDLGIIEGTPNVPTLIPNGQTEDVGSVQILDQASFNAMIAKLKDESPTPAVSGGPTTPAQALLATVATDPSRVTVNVEDGVGRTGLAAAVSSALNRQGFHTGAPGPAGRTGYARSEVHYAAGDGAALSAAKTVAGSVPGSVLVADPSIRGTSGVVLIVGANYQSVQSVIIGITPSPSASATPTPATTPTASPSPAAPAVTAANNICTY